MLKGITKLLDDDVIGPFEMAVLALLIYGALSILFPSIGVTLSSSNEEIVQQIFYYAYKLILIILPFAGTYFLIKYARMFWLHYVRANFISGITWVLLEIIPPREVLRSPAAMEMFLTNALYHWSGKSGLETWWQGAIWFWFSLEIASIEGQVHFYIRVPTRLKELVETQMYAAYPQANVKIAEDYTLSVDEISPTSKWNLWGCEFTYKYHQAYPIRTYVDFGLDDNPKEEEKVDPIAPVIELFSTMKKDEQMWLQIVVTPKTDKLEAHDWVEESQKELRRMLSEFTRTHPPSPDGTSAKEIRAPSFLDAKTKAASNKMMKVGFETGIRACYVAKREVFDLSHRRNIRLIFRQYAAPNQNELVRINSTQADAFSDGAFAWFKGFFPASNKKVMRLSNRMLLEYQEREFFYPPLRHKISFPWPISPVIFPNFFHPHTMVMSTEELATIWHFPGRILRVPTLERIESKEASPPTNLPI